MAGDITFPIGVSVGSKGFFFVDFYLIWVITPQDTLLSKTCFSLQVF